jgi:hypothetical protein
MNISTLKTKAMGTCGKITTDGKVTEQVGSI